MLGWMVRGAGGVGILLLGRRTWLLRNGDRSGCSVGVMDSCREEVKRFGELGMRL